MAALAARSEPIPVRYPEGSKRGFLSLRNLDGAIIASGEFRQISHGTRASTHVVFRFRDGSIEDETTVYSQRGTFQLLTDHLIQRGPSFPHPVDMTIDTVKGSVVLRSEENGKAKVETLHPELPADLSNGLVFTIINDLRPGTDKDEEKHYVTMLAGSSKPRLVKLAISPEAEETFSIAGQAHRARRYVVKIEIGGVAGVIAPLVGKAPADFHIWIAEGAPPTLLKAEGQFFEGGPVWRIELANAVWH